MNDIELSPAQRDLLLQTIDIVVHVRAHAGQRQLTGIHFDPQAQLEATCR